jgi:hypothetical protein
MLGEEGNLCYNSQKQEGMSKQVSNTTKKREKVELIVGLFTIGVAVVLLVALILGAKYIATRLSFSSPSQETPTMQTSTLPLPTSPALIPNPYDSRDFAYENGYLTCISGESWLGVDVSEYQGTIDWDKVASQNIRFAIVRMGARGWGSKGQILTDSRWEENLSGAKAAGLMVGVYFFSQAISVAEAKEEALFVLEKLDGQALDLPIVFDWEFAPAADARTANVTSEMLNSCRGSGVTPHDNHLYTLGYKALHSRGGKIPNLLTATPSIGAVLTITKIYERLLGEHPA